MAIVATRTAIHVSHANEVLELAEKILCRTRDHAFVQKVTILRGYLEMYRIFPQKDYGEQLSKALADVTMAVHIHLNSELHAAYSGFRRLS